MRRIVLLVFVAACLRAGAADAQQVYAGVLLEYLTGDADAAVAKLGTLDRGEILAGLKAFDTTRSRLVLPGAAALHTEAALRAQLEGVFGVNFHLQIATAIVEFGEHGKLKSNTPLAINPAYAAPVSNDFRTLWYCTVIGVLLNATRLKTADAYLNHALALVPANAEIRFLAGVEKEMRASPRTSGLSAGDRRDALKAAEAHYRFVLTARPDRLEARLRLGRILQQRHELTDARALLTPLTTVADNRIAYLALLFLGGIEDATRNPDAALAAYDAAVARMPTAQTARLAASELRHRKGDRHGAADAVPAAIGDGNAFDPWWAYIFGEYWRADMMLAALRKLRRA
jgi:hypothetical protein